MGEMSCKYSRRDLSRSSLSVFSIPLSPLALPPFLLATALTNSVGPCLARPWNNFTPGENLRMLRSYCRAAEPEQSRPGQSRPGQSRPGHPTRAPLALRLSLPFPLQNATVRLSRNNTTGPAWLSPRRAQRVAANGAAREGAAAHRLPAPAPPGTRIPPPGTRIPLPAARGTDPVARGTAAAVTIRRERVGHASACSSFWGCSLCSVEDERQMKISKISF